MSASRATWKMKFSTTLLSSISGLLLATQAHAFTYLDFDDYGPSSGYVASGGSLTGYFNIKNSDGGVGDITGYKTTPEHVVNATASFGIRDNSGLLDKIFFFELASIYVGSDQFMGTTGSISLNLDFSHGISANALVDLSADGILKYTIVSTIGDFYLDYAKLTANTVADSAPSVPDGGSTALLLGSSLLGLVALRQKFATAA